jgi:hypothetical protein
MMMYMGEGARPSGLWTGAKHAHVAYLSASQDMAPNQTSAIVTAIIGTTWLKVCNAWQQYRHCQLAAHTDTGRQSWVQPRSRVDCQHLRWTGRSMWWGDACQASPYKTHTGYLVQKGEQMHDASEHETAHACP